MTWLEAVRLVTVVALLLGVPGWIVDRARGGRADLFARTWFSLALTSLAGLTLAWFRVFSLGTLLASVAVAMVVGAIAARRLWPADRSVASGSPLRVRALAAAAGLATVLLCWPPFETFIATSDSTMYVDAGVHLARIGSLVVPETVSALFSHDAASGLFPSLGGFDLGPFIRLAGGLLMTRIEDREGAPAFSLLTCMWSGIVAAAGGPEAAPVVAPLFAALGVWAVVLFAGEAFGLLTAAATALLLLANLAIWWFGRFPVSEMPAMTFLWGALVFLGRGAFLPAGALFALAGVTRTENLVFVPLAAALWAAWDDVPRARLRALAIGFGALAVPVCLTIAAPSAQYAAQLMNETFFALWRLAEAIFPMPDDKRQVQLILFAMLGAFVLTALLIAVALRRVRLPAFFGSVRSRPLLVFVAAVAAYALLDSAPQPLRQVHWLAAYCSWPLLALALGGALVVFRDGNGAVRFACCLWLLVAIVFIANPRVGHHQPWAMRRFVPVVVPGIAVAAAAAIARVAADRRPAVRVAALALLATVVGLELRPWPPLWRRPLFVGTFAAIADLAAAIPPDAVVAVEIDFADLQLQVPLWLVHGRETMLLPRSGRGWALTMRTLVASGRPVYWVADRLGDTRGSRDDSMEGLVLQAPRDIDVSILVPTATSDDPPAAAGTRLVPLRIARVVARGD